jgi:hypothetical protein
MKQSDISSLFNKFAGKEIPLERQFVNGLGEEMNRIYGMAPVNDDDPVLADMAKTATDNNLKLVITYPGGARSFFNMKITDLFDIDNGKTMSDLVSSTVEKSTDGKFHVTNKFTLS